MGYVRARLEQKGKLWRSRAFKHIFNLMHKTPAKTNLSVEKFVLAEFFNSIATPLISAVSVKQLKPSCKMQLGFYRCSHYIARRYV